MSRSYRHRKVLEKVVDIDYVLKVWPVLHIHFFVTVSLHRLFFRVIFPLHHHFKFSLSCRHGQSVSLTNASPLFSLVIILVRSIIAMPARTKNSPIQQCPSCV